jgi:hypothetical protein
MSVVKFNNQQWEKIFALLKTCQNIYIGQESDCRNFLEAVFGSPVPVRNGVCCLRVMAIGTAFTNALPAGRKPVSLKTL